MNLTLLMKQTGETKVQSPLLKTREIAVPAGLSLLLLPWKDYTFKRITNSWLSPNNNLWTALDHMVTVDAMVVKWIVLSNMLKQTRWSLRLITYTQPKWELVWHLVTKEYSRFPNIMMSKVKIFLSSKLRLINKLSLLLSKLIRWFFSNTQVEFLILNIVDKGLTTVLTLLDTPRMPGSLRTLGDPHGVMTDTYISLRAMRIFVVS